MFPQILPTRRHNWFVIVVSCTVFAGCRVPANAQSTEIPLEKQSSAHRLTVSATGEVRAKPDKVEIAVGVETEDKLASVAVQANADRASKLTSALVASGVLDADIQTTEYNVEPITANPLPGKPQLAEITSFRVTNEIRVTVRDIKKAGSTLDLAIQNGANVVHGLTYGVTEQEVLHDQALEIAVKRARHRADILAQAAGVTIAAVYEISDSTGPRPTPVFASRVMIYGETQTPISPGVVSISASVTVVYEIVDPGKPHRSSQPPTHGPIERPQAIK